MSNPPRLITAPLCDEVAGTADPVLRNLRITQSYADLSERAARSLGPGHANWCSFATWASREAGNFIRNEEVPGPMRAVLAERQRAALGEEVTPRSSTVSRLHWLIETHPIIKMIGYTTEDVAEHIAAGNLKVYAELGPIFARFFDMVEASSGDPSADALEDFLATLEPGPTEEGGQEHLRTAFRGYREALAESDPKLRAELIFHANGLIGLHEQTRLQAAIEGALVAPFARIRARRAKVASHLPGPLRSMGQRIKERGLDPADKLEAAWLRACTAFMMTLALPEQILNLGADVPPLGDGSAFPGSLRELRRPPVIAIVERFSRARDGLRGSAAKNWADLDDRMNYILNLFRSRHEAANLHEAPFPEAEERSIRAGERPSSL